MQNDINFKDGSPTTFEHWYDLDRTIIPCIKGIPIVKNWSDDSFKITRQEWEKKFSHCEIALRLDDDVDFDIDNHFIKKFVEKYLKSCGAISGRQSNPKSHYWWKGKINFKQFELPKELEIYCKDFPHGSMLCEIRNGSGHYTIVPGSKHSKANEVVSWEQYASLNEYKGDLQKDISKIALSGALSILYAPRGKRDDYCTAIAGVLLKHTEWSVSEIDEFVYNLAIASGDDEARDRMSKGSTGKDAKKMFGIPTLAEIVDCSTKSISDIFSWVGVKDSGSCFTGLKVYETNPKYWQLEYKGKWITIMESAILLSYAKISVLILENCYEVAPIISPKDWKTILYGLLQKVQKIEAPIESSYMGVVAGVFIKWLEVHTKENWSSGSVKHTLGGYGGCAKDETHYWFKLEGVTNELKRRQMSFEMRKLTHFLREEFGCEPTKITIDKKELRVWKVPTTNIQNHFRNNVDVEGMLKKNNERLDKIEKETGYRYRTEIPF